MIVLRRNNKIVNEDALLDAPAGAAISFDFEVMRVRRPKTAPRPNRGDAGAGRAGAREVVADLGVVPRPVARHRSRTGRRGSPKCSISAQLTSAT
jgi:hypothetical protein